MTTLLQNRTISMILLVPEVEIPTLSSSSSIPIVEKHDQSDVDQPSFNTLDDQASNIDTTPSIPVYHGSIVRIEQHSDDQNTSDLIVRVPNFQHRSSPCSEIDMKQRIGMKRRAPICPVLNSSNNSPSTNMNYTENFDDLNLRQPCIANTNRLTTGLRSLSRVFTHGCTSKQSTNICEITFPPTLPDVEVMTEKSEILVSAKKNAKDNSLTSTVPKLTPPKMLFIKRKHLKIKKKQTSSSSSSSITVDTPADLEYKQMDLTSTSTIITTQYAEVTKPPLPKMTTFFHRFIEENDSNEPTNSLDDDHKQQENETRGLTYEVEKQFNAISRLVSDNPISSLDGDSLSTHRYSTISAIVPDFQPFISNKSTRDTSSPDASSTTIPPTSTRVSYDFDNKLPASFPSKINQPFRVQTSILQPDISVVRMGRSDLTTRADRLLPGENLSSEQINCLPNREQKLDDDNHIEQDQYGTTHTDDETFAECYEVTYQIDRNEQIINHSTIPIEINLDPSEYKDLVSCLPLITENEYEQIERNSSRNYQRLDERENSLEHLSIIPNAEDTLTKNTKRIPFHSTGNSSPTSNDQTSPYQLDSISTSSSSSSSSTASSRHCTLQRTNSYDGFGICISTDLETRRDHFIGQVEEFSPGDQAGLQENDRILCINGTPVVSEDYTVVLQLIKDGLQTDTLAFDVITNDAYEEFQSQRRSTS